MVIRVLNEPCAVGAKVISTWLGWEPGLAVKAGWPLAAVTAKVAVIVGLIASIRVRTDWPPTGTGPKSTADGVTATSAPVPLAPTVAVCTTSWPAEARIVILADAGPVVWGENCTFTGRAK